MNARLASPGAASSASRRVPRSVSSASRQWAHCCSTCSFSRKGSSSRCVTCSTGSGFDIRVLATDAPPSPAAAPGPIARPTSRLPSIERPCTSVRIGSLTATSTAPADDDHRSATQVERGTELRQRLHFLARTRGESMWTVLHGRDLPDNQREIVLVNDRASRTLVSSRTPASSLRGPCATGRCAAARDFRHRRHRRFPIRYGYRRARPRTLLTRTHLRRRVRIAPTSSRPIHAGRRAPRRRRDLRAAHPGPSRRDQRGDGERFSRVEFSYFRQISTVLTTVTLSFGFLLITVLLTVSVNQRLGEVAALRALGFRGCV